MLPHCQARKLYRGDILFSEGDIADEVVFVLNGSIHLYKDISDLVPLPEKLIDEQSQAFNVPFARYGSSSFFGDEDCLMELLNDKSSAKKLYRESTAEVVDDAELYVIKRRQLTDELNKFSGIKTQMVAAAYHKKEYHKTLINAILTRYSDPQEK